MNSQPSISSQDDQPEVLLHRYFKGQITDEDAQRLLNALDKSPLLLNEAVQNYEIEHVLRFFARLENQSVWKLARRQDSCSLPNLENPFQNESLSDTTEFQFLWEKLRSLSAFSASFTPQDRPAASISRAIDVTFLSHRRFVLTIACLLIVLPLSLFFLFRFHASDPPRPPRALARISSMLDVHWPEEGEPMKEGRWINTEQLRFQSGLMELTLANGVRFILEGPVDFRLNTDRKAFCSEGLLNVEVPAKEKGFEVITPFLSVVDLGTAFSLSIDQHKVEAHVHVGKIALERLKDSTIELTKGNAMRVDSLGKTAPLEFDPSLYRSDWRHRIAEHHHEKSLFRSEQLGRWENDAGLLVFFRFDEKGSRIVNHADFGKQRFPEGKLISARRSEGRWSQRNSVVFRRRQDMVQINLPVSMTSTTFSASVRVEQLNRPSQVIFASRALEAGAFVWQILQDGSIQLLVYPSTEAQPVTYRSRQVFTPEKWGCWYHLSMVVDARTQTVVHYVDGKKIDVLPLQSNLSIKPGNSIIGNGPSQKNSLADRFLDGAIDEFFIFDRALSEEEIVAISSDNH